MALEKIKQFNKKLEQVEKGEGPSFDHEAEKEKRKEIKKMLEGAISELIKPIGFKKEGAYWRRKIDDVWQIVYLQRSQFSHSYYLEIGTCKAEGEKPKIFHCQSKNRERIKSVNFEISGASEKYPGEYFLPSISIEEAQDKVKDIQENIKEYVPSWFDEHSEDN